jgi:hypothetical protein
LVCSLLGCIAVSELARGAESVATTVSVTALTDTLPAKPEGPIPGCADRNVWGNKQLQVKLHRITKGLRDQYAVAVPPWSDAAYLEFLKTGERPAGERMMKVRQALLTPLVLAECIEYKGKYINAIAKVLEELVSQPTWVFPASDQRLETFRKERYFVDLNAADVADQIAQALYLLRGRIPASLEAKAQQALERRVFDPMRLSIDGAVVKGHEWLGFKNNWIPICFEGVVSAALVSLPDRSERARFILASAHYLQGYLSGFEADGYSSEGLAYWNYGFGRYLELREVLVRATEGLIDLLAEPKVHQVAMFGARFAMSRGNAALFGDAAVGTRPDHNATVYTMQALNWRNPDYAEYEPPLSLILLVFGRASPYRGTAPQGLLDPLRHYFQDAGVLVSRPGPASSSRLSVTMKSGGNANHSHNDIGSYVIGIGSDQPVGDPGGVLNYNRKSFGVHRYESRVFNSFGHPVPVVANGLQKDASKFKPPKPKVRFGEDLDEFEVDLTGAYSEPSLKSLTRSMRYSRAETGSVRVTDSFEFASPRSFETAITTRGEVRRLKDGSIEFKQGTSTVWARIQASGDTDLNEEEVEEGGIRFKRVGIQLRRPSLKGSVSIEYSSVPGQP